MQLSDSTFITQFENLSLNPENFNHIGHLRLCWLYLNQYELESAIEKTCTGIQLYATSLGAKEKFHRTITEFLVRMINDRNQMDPCSSFDVFLDKNEDLVTDALSLLEQYYSNDLLDSPAARISYLKPDLIQLSL